MATNLYEQDDRVLFQQVREGNEEAFREVYWKYHKLLYAVAFRMLKERYATENAVQHVFVKLWLCRGEMSVLVSLRNYLYTMTRNYVLNYLRNRNTELIHHFQMAQQTPLSAGSLDAQIDREDLSRVLDEVIERLPQQKRQVMHLRKAGYSNPEIAELLDLSVHTVRSHYQEGVRMLRSQLGRIVVLLTLFYRMYYE